MNISIRLFRAALLLPLILCITTFATAQINIDPPTRTFTKDGGGGAILTSGSGTWTANTAAPWITITPRTTADAGVSCIYVVSSNLSADTRQGDITVGGQTHTVTQTGYAATLSPTSATADLNGSSGVISITTQAGVSWSAVSNAEWISVTPASGMSNGSVAYTVDPYAGVVSRTGSMTIAGKTFSITQTGADVNLEPKSTEKAYSSDIIQVQVAALGTTLWSVTSQSSWISIVDDGNGFGDSTVTLAISTNPSFATRTGIVNIGTANLTIKQAGTPNPVLDLLPREATADPIGAFGNVAVVATPDAPWTAESMDSWLTISGGASGAGNGNIQYVASANPGLTPRVGRIRVNPPVYVPAVDLTKQLWTYIVANDTSDSSGWARNLSGTINTFDGTFSRTLTGNDFDRENSNAMTLSVQFKVNSMDTINRLFQIQRSSTDYTSVYTDAQNKLVVHIADQSFVTEFTVQAGLLYQLVFVAADNHQVKLYAGVVGSDEIGLIGSYSPDVAPFPHDYVSATNRFTFGYSAVPNAGYLNEGGMEELRIYGRALDEIEVEALHMTSATGTPFGQGITEATPVAAMKMNLRGQALADLSDGVVLGAAGLSFDTDTALGSAEREVRRTLVGGILIPSIKGLVSFRVGPNSSANAIYIYWKYRFYYMDGTSSVTSQDNVSGYYQNRLYSASRTVGNPNPDKPVKSVSLIARSVNGGYIASYSGSFDALGVSKRSLLQWSRGNDRFDLAERALVSRGTSTVAIENHDLYFSNSSATYNFWLRMDSMPSDKIIFSRGSLFMKIASDGSLKLGGPVTATFPSPIEVGKWHMITVAGNYSPATATVYVDGEEIGNMPGSSYRYGNTSTVDMTIGHASSGFIGAIDEVAFYNGVLTPTEVRSIYEREAPQSIYHTVTQGVVAPAVSPQLIQVPAAGGTKAVDLTLAQNVNWAVSTSDAWITVTTAAQGAGSTTVSFDVVANPTVYERQGEIDVAGKTVTVVQAGLNASVTHDDLVFATDGGSGWIDVSPEGNGQWQAVSDVSWLTIAIGETGAGAGSVFIVADPYTNTSSSRTGSVTVAGQKVYVTQRGYTLSINPEVAEIGSNAGAGEFGVAAPLSSVWEAIATQPWITITGGTSGIGNGTIRYSIAENDTGIQRTGRIIVAGEEYTVTQNTSLLMTTTTDGNGSVTGSGPYQTNASATLSATPSSGFAFSHWTGDAVGSANPLTVNMDSSKAVMAHFIPTVAADTLAASGKQEVLNDPNAYSLYTQDQLKGMALGNTLFKKDSITGKMSFTLNLMKSTDMQNWGRLILPEGDVSVKDGSVEIQITPEDNAAFYFLDSQQR